MIRRLTAAALTGLIACGPAWAVPPVVAPPAAAVNDPRITGALQSTSNLLDVQNAATARTNLGAAPLASPAFTGTASAPQINLGSSPGTTTPLLVSGYNSGDNTQGAQIKLQNTAPGATNGAMSIRLEPNGTLRWLNNSYSSIGTLDQTGALAGFNVGGLAVTATGATTAQTFAKEFSRFYYADQYGAKLDARPQCSYLTVSGTSVTAASGTVCGGTPFQSSDVGKTIVLPLMGTPGVQGGAFITTIAAYTSTSQITLTAAPPNPIPAGTYSAMVIGTDDTTAINAANTAAVNNGGGRVVIPPGKAALATGVVNVGNSGARHVTFWGGDMAASALFTTGQAALNGTSGTILGVPQTNGDPAVKVYQNSGIFGLAILNATVPYNVATGTSITWRDAMNGLTAFNGNGVNFIGSDSLSEKSFVAGFANGFYNNGFSRVGWNGNLADNFTNYYLGNDYDFSFFDNNWGRPVAFSAPTPEWDITNVTQNGSGGIRLTMELYNGATINYGNSWKSGDPVMVVGVTGTAIDAVNWRWIAYLPNPADPTVIDLYQYDITKLGSAFSTSTATMSTFPPGGVYSTGGVAGFAPAYRPGTSFVVNGTATGSVGHTFVNNASWGHDTALSVRGSGWLDMTNFKAECTFPLPYHGVAQNSPLDNYTTGIRVIDNSSVTFNGGYLTLCATDAVVDSLNADSNLTLDPPTGQVTFTSGFNFSNNLGTTTLVLKSGHVKMDGIVNKLPAFVIEDGAATQRLTISGSSDIRGAVFLAQTPTNLNRVSIAPSVRTATDGTAGPVPPGAFRGVDSALINTLPGIYLPSPWNDQQGLYATGAPSSGSTIAGVTGQKRYRVTGGSTLAALTKGLPPTPNANDQFCISTDPAITALTLTGGTVVGAPTGLAANSSACFEYDGTTSWHRQ